VIIPPDNLRNTGAASALSNVSLPEGSIPVSAPITYVVDRFCRISSYAREPWDKFANENGCAALTMPERVMGASLLDFIEGDDVRDAYRDLVEAVFEGQVPRAHIYFRCDSPQTLRHGWLTLAPVNLDGSLSVSFRSAVVAAAPNPAPLGFRHPLDQTAPITTICSLCKKLKLSDRWLTTEAYFARGGSPDVRLSHGLCPVCERALRLSTDSPETAGPAL
jgi:hypothetical protein